MAFQFGSTTRLRHMNYPENQKRTQWEQTEAPSPVVDLSPLHKNPPFTLEGNEENTLRSQGQIDKGNNLVTNHRKEALSIANYRSENTNGKMNNNNIKMQTTYSTHHLISRNISTTSQQSQVSIELDVLESFSEFAAFLELQNPICPAEHLDTPEKLMSVLAWDVWVQ